MRERGWCLPVFQHTESSPGSARWRPARGRCGLRSPLPRTWGTSESRKAGRPPAPAHTSMRRGKAPPAGAGHEPWAEKINGKRELVQKSLKHHSCSSSSSITFTPPFPGWPFCSFPSTFNSFLVLRLFKNTLKRKKKILLNPKILYYHPNCCEPQLIPQLQGNTFMWLYFFWHPRNVHLCMNRSPETLRSHWLLAKATSAGDFYLVIPHALHCKLRRQTSSQQQHVGEAEEANFIPELWGFYLWKRSSGSSVIDSCSGKIWLAGCSWDG